MTTNNQPIPGDQARVSVVVGVPPDVAFRIFTEEIDLWWRRGLKYRVAGTNPGSIHMEPRQFFQSFIGLRRLPSSPHSRQSGSANLPNESITKGGSFPR